MFDCSSMNSGDAYILLTGGTNDVYTWCGRFANAIEKSRVAEVAQSILTSKDLGCKARQVTAVEEESPGVAGRKFWRLLSDATATTPADPSGNPDQVGAAGPADEDDTYVATLNELNLVYSVDADNCQLVPEETAWGSVPRYELLSGMLFLIKIRLCFDGPTHSLVYLVWTLWIW